MFYSYFVYYERQNSSGGDHGNGSELILTQGSPGIFRSDNIRDDNLYNSHAYTSDTYGDVWKRGYETLTTSNPVKWFRIPFDIWMDYVPVIDNRTGKQPR